MRVPISLNHCMYISSKLHFILNDKVVDPALIFVHLNELFQSKRSVVLFLNILCNSWWLKCEVLEDVNSVALNLGYTLDLPGRFFKF